MFDNIFDCGDNMNNYYDMSKKRSMYLKIKNLYKDKKYGTVEREATKFLEQYPNDVLIRFMRAKSYRKLNRFDEALYDLEYNLNIDTGDHTITELFFLYYYLNMYEEALKILPSVYKRKSINAHSLVIAEIIMKIQLGKELNIKINSDCNYIIRQIYNYNSDITLEHIRNNHTQTNENECCFDKNVDLDYLFELVKNNLKNENKVNKAEILEIHYIGISNVGYINNDICNYIKVVVTPNTTNILNIYPINEVDYNYVYNIECDYNKLFNNKKDKTKKLTQIDKFNNRYKRV